MLLAALALAQGLDVTAGQLPAPPPQFPYTSNAGIDLGCVGGGLYGSRFPGNVTDTVHHETIMYNVSRCTGGYIKATSDTTGPGWNVQIGPGGKVSGKDLAGHSWRYDAATHRYVVAATGVSCARPDYRAMCAAAN